MAPAKKELLSVFKARPWRMRVGPRQWHAHLTASSHWAVEVGPLATVPHALKEQGLEHNQTHATSWPTAPGFRYSPATPDHADHTSPRAATGHISRVGRDLWRAPLPTIPNPLFWGFPVCQAQGTFLAPILIFFQCGEQTRPRAVLFCSQRGVGSGGGPDGRSDQAHGRLPSKSAESRLSFPLIYLYIRPHTLKLLSGRDCS